MRTTGPSAVIAIVCSKCAARLPSAVAIDQPSASVRPCVAAALDQHRLDRDDQALAQPHPASGTPGVGHVRVLVHGRPDAVPAAALQEPVRPRDGLHGVGDVAEPPAGPPRPRSPAVSASRVVSIRRTASSSTAPTGTVTAASPWYPPTSAPQSIDRMSPSASTRPSGMPCTTTSLTDRHSVAGYGVGADAGR